MEIGSIYEINPDVVSDADAFDSPDFTLEEIKKYHKAHCVFTASGREAIALSLRAIAQNRPDLKKVCLLPAYMCDSVFRPFQQAGWRICFYHIKKNLEADKENLISQVSRCKPGLLFIHPYYGMDTWRFLRPALRDWQAQGICVMEDVTQSYYLKNTAWEADYIVGSLRKWYPVPDGGFAASDEPLPSETLSDDRTFARAKLKSFTEKWRYLHIAASPEEKKNLKSTFLQENREMEEWLDHHKEVCSLSRESMKILAGLDEYKCRQKRSENYHYLSKKLSGKTCFTPVFAKDDVSPDAAPLYFPIYAERQNELQRFLAGRDIYAPLLWPLGEENKDCLAPAEQEIYDHILALPIDQRYGLSEMRRIAESLDAYEQQESRNTAPALLRAQEPETETIAIRADANETVATGHIMRCITIARSLEKKGRKVLFFTADEYPRAMLAQAGMESVCLGSSWNRMEEELPLLREELEKYHCRKLLVDSYQVTENYFEKLKNFCRTIYIDDCFAAVYPADLIINYNAYHTRFPYRESYSGRARLLLGTAYVPLREEFQNAPSKSRPSGGGVLVSSGGGDVYNALGGVLMKAMEHPTLSGSTFHVVVGRFNKNAEELTRLAQNHPNIKLHHNVTDMAALMGQCRLAISAAGTMLFELCAMELPTVFYVCADNQQYDSEFFARENRMLFSGDIRHDREACLDRILENAERLLSDGEMRRQMKRKLHEVTDGGGADRIAEAIITL